MTSKSEKKGLDICGVTKKFGEVIAVDNVEINIKTGEFLTLLGPSGSGKTTMLMMIAGFEEITSGDILFDGCSIAYTPPDKREFGMVFQGYALFPHMTVRENIGYPLSVRKKPASQISARIDEMLYLVRLDGYANRLPKQLSGGQQQRVALARALCFAPRVLLLDEPLGALDKKLRVEVQAQLKEIHTRVGTTFIYVTHDQEEALSMSDRVVIMNHGRVMQVGSPEEIYEKPNTVFSAGFLGKSNFLRQNGKIFALRPEKIDIRSAGMKAAKVSGTINSITYFGSTISFIVSTSAHGNLEVTTDAWRMEEHFRTGQAVDLSWREEAILPVSK